MPNFQTPLSFISDNCAGASSEVMQALLSCNSGSANPYGSDDLTMGIETKLAELFEHEVSVFLVSTGTAANSICLATLSPPWGSVYCHAQSHINNDECAAPEFFSQGAKLVSVPGIAAKIDAQELAAAVSRRVGDIHSTQPGCVSITQATELGTLYTVSEIAEIGEVCQSANIGLHMDGSRFANAVATLGCSPAQMTWKAGVKALSFGASKNGVLGAEAIVLFDQSLAQEIAFRRKRAGHLTSKMRFLSAQMDAYLKDDLWLANAHQSNLMAQRLSEGLGRHELIEILEPPQANILFCRFPLWLTQRLLDQGCSFLHDRWEEGVVRLVTSFATTDFEVDLFLQRVQAALNEA
jgi:threonine aldolase